MKKKGRAVKKAQSWQTRKKKRDKMIKRRRRRWGMLKGLWKAVVRILK